MPSLPTVLPDSVSRQLLAFAEVKSAPGRWRFALHATTSTAIAVVIVSLIFGPSLGIIAITAAFIGITAPNRPPRSRAVILAAMSGFYTLAVALGALVSGQAVLLTALLAVISLVGVLGYNTLIAEPPGPMFLLMGPAIASYLPTVGVPPLTVISISALGAVCGSAASLLLNLAVRKHPEEAAVALARTNATRYVEAPAGTDRTDLGRMRDQAYAAIFSASMLLESAVGREPRSKRWRRLNRELRNLHAQVIRRLARAHLGDAKVAVGAMEARRYLGSPGVAYLLRWGASQASLPWLAARRVALAITLTCIVSYGLQVSHPYWAVMTTALVMSVQADRLTLTHRAAHRLAGTAAGIGVFIAIHALHPRGIWILVVALTLVFFIQWTAVQNYAIACLFVTPMALLISTGSHPDAPVGNVMAQRVLETALGAVISVFVIWVTGRRTPIMLVRRQFRRALRSLEHLLIVVADNRQGTSDGFTARRDLAFEQLKSAQILQIAQRDLPLTLGTWSAVEAALNEVSYTVLAACWTTNPPDAINAAAMASGMQRLISDLPPVSTATIDAEGVARELSAILRVGTHTGRE